MGSCDSLMIWSEGGETVSAFGDGCLHLAWIDPQSTWLKRERFLQGQHCSRNGMSQLSGMSLVSQVAHRQESELLTFRCIMDHYS